MKTVLVIWIEHNNFPKFIVLNVSPKQCNKIKSFHNRFINVTENTDDISDFFYDQDTWKLKFDVFDEVIESENFNLIIMTGHV